jgi:hypothetical protein
MAALPTAQAAMDAHRGVAEVVRTGLFFLAGLAQTKPNQVSYAGALGLLLSAWCTSLRTFVPGMSCTPSVMLVCCVQVPLMAALPTALAAMDAHRGVAEVVWTGLFFLVGLTQTNANQVSYAGALRLLLSPW